MYTGGKYLPIFIRRLKNYKQLNNICLQKNDRKQIDFFKSGFPNLKIVAPATEERGIKLLSENEQITAVDKFNNYDGEVCKFVPASGAATRMFKDLYDGLAKLEKEEEPDKGSAINSFLENLSRFSFFNELTELPGFDINNRLTVLKQTLFSTGLNYGGLAKRNDKVP